MASGNEVSRSSGGPIGSFPLNPPWQEEEKMKTATEAKPNMTPIHDAYSALKANEYTDSKPIYDDKAMRSVLDMYDPIMKGGAGLIAMERQRQLKQEGWSPEHDDDHKLGELSQASIAYATVASSQVSGASHEEFPADMMIAEGDWPWEESWWKPSPDPILNLVFAGALIAAEIDRLQRLRKPV